ncbi:unnamed protein product [Euphydryas editha]|uniref:Arrestin C-terminal-like domain-containing protein n=1 Tax=Euphydryas editha TaxID=104508 RepID=A0AAU9TLE9_EUPED|nr:unnamed protein product [Euphydryas editha]
MGFDEGQIVLDSLNGTYYSGQTIRGNLIFQQDTVKTFRGLYVKFKGFCKVHWTTRETRRVNGRNVSRTKSHYSYEKYVSVKMYLVGTESGDHALQPGNYNYSFTFQLPINCPSSFEGAYGHVRYQIKAVIDKSFKFDQEKKVAIRVMNPLDLNMNPYCRVPMVMDFDANYYCCCFKSGSTNTVANIPVSGFCPGQKFPIKVSCTNKGTVKVDHVKFRILKHVDFIATHHPGIRSIEDILVEVRKGPIPGNTTCNWTVEMLVPALDVYNLSGCNYIFLTYKLEVVVSPSGCHRDSNESREIIIGTVPLVGFQDYVLNPLQDQMPQQIDTMFQQPHRNYPYSSSNTSYPSSIQPYPNNDESKLPYPPSNISHPNTYTNLHHPNAPYAPPYPGNNLPYPAIQSVTPDNMESRKGVVSNIGLTMPGGSKVDNTSFSGSESTTTVSVSMLFV